jgi:hypothetical protein
MRVQILSVVVMLLAAVVGPEVVEGRAAADSDAEY